MGSKASTPATPVSDDSSPTRQIYSRAERVSDYEQSARQARQERSFMERAESSIQNFIYSNNTSSVDIQRNSQPNGERSAPGHNRLGSSLETPAHQPARPNSIPTGSSRSYSIGSAAAGAHGQSDSTSSSMSSHTGLSHFLSSFNLWRASGPSSSDRQRAQSLSHMPDQALHHPSSATGQSGDSSRPRYETEEPSSLSNPRAALTRLLSSRDGRSSNTSNNPSANSSESGGHHQRRDNSGAFSVRDLTFAAAQEFLAEATLNGLGLGRVYVTHSLPSHMWAVNGSCMAKETSVASLSIPVYPADSQNSNLPAETREPLRLLMVNGENHSTGDNQQYRMARALLRPIPYNYIHGTSQPLREQHARRVVHGIKCPVCSKFIMPDDIECHLVMCLTKPRLNYNEDVLTEDKGECVICLEDLLKGHVIARLPCLCVYHKSCIDQWFDVNRSCPEHPSD